MNTFIKFYVPAYMVVFFFTTIFLKSYLQYKKTGVNPLAFGRRSESAHDYIGSWFKLILGLVFIHGFLYPFFSPLKIQYLDMYPLQAAGIVLTAASFLFTVYAQRSMAESWRIGIDEEVKTRLVTGGPFRYTRNPIFSAMLAAFAGLFLIMPTYFMAVLFILSYLLTNIQIRLEEEYLERVHGSDYTEYKSSRVMLQ